MNLSIKQILCSIVLGGVMVVSQLLTAQGASEKSVAVDQEKAEVKPKLKVISSSRPSVEQKKVLDEPETDRIFRRDLILQTNEILKKIQHAYPALSESLTVEKQKDILKAIVASLGHGMRYISAEDLAVKRKIKENRDIFPAIMMSFGKILYIRMDSFSDKTLSQLKKDCENSAEFAEKLVGIIIDLRNSQGDDYNAAVHAASLFAGKTKLAELNLRSSLSQTLKQPAILLTGERTRGAAEIFTSVLLKSKRAISLGEKSAGVPFKKREVLLSNGDYLLIPQIPERLKNIQPVAIKPSILFTPYPQLDYRKLKETPDSEKSDKCIRRAIELILCLNALKKE
jgi:hypothetical protein